MTEENGNDFEVVNPASKPVAAPTPVPEAPAKPQNFLLDLAKHGTTVTQGYESEEKRDQMFHYYDQRGFQCRARNKTNKPAAQVTQQDANA